MKWKLDADIGSRTLATIAASTRTQGNINVWGARLSSKRLKTFLADDLLLREEDMVDDRSVADRLESLLHLPIEPIDEVAEAMADVEMAEATHGLLRHMRIDPLRFALSSFATRMEARRGAEIVKAEVRTPPVRSGAGNRTLDVTVILAKGISWRNGQLSARGVELPQTVVATMAGRSLTGIVDHDWNGWADMKIVEARQDGVTLVVRTGREDAMPLVNPRNAMMKGKAA